MQRKRKEQRWEQHRHRTQRRQVHSLKFYSLCPGAKIALTGAEAGRAQVGVSSVEEALEA